MYFLRNRRTRGTKCERVYTDTRRKSLRKGRRRNSRSSNQARREASENQIFVVKQSSSNAHGQTSVMSKQISKALKVSNNRGINERGGKSKSSDVLHKNLKSVDNVSSILNKSSQCNINSPLKEKFYLCSKCGAQLKSENSIVHHELNHDYEDCCKKVKFKRQSFIATKTFPTSPIKYFHCFCGQIFKSKIGLNAHRSTRNCSCQHLNSPTYSEDLYEINPFILFCLLCSYKPLTELDLKLHIATDHPDLSNHIEVHANSECEENSDLNIVFNYI